MCKVPNGLIGACATAMSFVRSIRAESAICVSAILKVSPPTRAFRPTWGFAVRTKSYRLTMTAISY